MSETLQNQPIEYNMKVVRQFTVMTIIWGIVGMALGVLIAAQLVWPRHKTGRLMVIWQKIREFTKFTKNRYFNT